MSDTTSCREVLVNCRGFIGDILFASSIARRIKEAHPSAFVRYNIPLVQPLLLLEENPYIGAVTVGPLPQPFSKLDVGIDHLVQIPEVDQSRPATVQFQEAAGIADPTTGFDVFTVPEYDDHAERIIAELRRRNRGKQIVAWQRNWEYKAYRCTPDSIRNKVGAPHRDIDGIIKRLEEHCVLIPVGFDRHVGQYDPRAADAESFARTASVIKHCDFMLGSEGGLTNLACAVGTRCIITTCFIAQLYWYNGHVKQIDRPMMGPAVYYPDGGHTHLSPFASDDEIYSEILWVMKGGETSLFDWRRRDG